MGKPAAAPEVAIVDYGLGNLFSIKHAAQRAGLRATITASGQAIDAADAVILPGVGAFGDAMASLDRLDLAAPLRDVAASGKPLIGICLGMQLLMSESEEFGRHKGLNIVEGEVLRIRLPDAGLLRAKVPHVGWSAIRRTSSGWNGSLLDGVDDGAHMYFVHSYHVRPRDPGLVRSTSRIGTFEFCSSLSRGAIFGCQFHPERSGPHGLRMYQSLAVRLERGADVLGAR